MEKYTYRQLTNDCELSSSQQKEISEMIYDTDPYIYPALFGSKEQALKTVPRMLMKNDVMICRENLYIVMEAEHVQGLILWHRGPLFWEDAEYMDPKSGMTNGFSEYLPIVKKEYFDSYNNVPQHVISIINVCVHSDCRGKGIGELLMTHFLEYIGRQFEKELFVLADNTPAIRLYRSCGFEITESMDGFSMDKKKPLCCKMVCHAVEENKRQITHI